MKTPLTLRLATLLCTAAAFPARGQEAPARAVPPVIEPAAGDSAAARRMPTGSMLDQVKFMGADMQTIIDYLDKKEAEAGGRPLNVVLAAGAEQLTVPSVSLRNVTTTEVLAVCASLLGLKVEPVDSDKGDRPVAWLVKPAEAPAAPVSAPATPGTAQSSVVTLAATAKPAPQSRVFGIAALLPKAAPTAESARARDHRLAVLLDNLIRFAKEQDPAAELRAYPELDLLMVKSTALPLIEQAIEAMGRDAGSKALEEAEARAARAVESAAEQNAMLAEANSSLRALQRESEQREQDMQALQQRLGELTKELESLRAGATPR